MSCGTSVLCPAAWLEMPTTCTSFSIASRAASSGVWNSGPMSTSKPRSANAVAITLAPRSWPSWPSLATRMRGRRPSSCANVVDFLADPVRTPRRPAYAPPYTPEIDADHGAVAAEHLLHRVGDLAHRRPRARRVDRRARAGCASPSAPSVSASSAASHSLRIACRPCTRSSRAICWRRTSVLSMSRDVDAATRRSSRYLLTPTIVSSPRSTARLAPRRGFLDAQLRHARLDGLGHAAERLDLFDQLPRLVGEALRERLDVVRAAERVDHVGDAGLLGEDQLRVARDARRELASAARSPRRSCSCAGSACRRAPPPALRRRCARCCCTGSCSVSDTPDVWQCVRSIFEPGFFAPRSFMMRAHRRRAARSFATSMKKFMPIAKKNESRPANVVDVEPAAGGVRARTRARRRA